MHPIRPLAGILLALAFASPGPAQDEPGTDPARLNSATPREADPVWEGDLLDREELVRRVLELNPSVAAARAAWRAARQRIPQAESLMDPMATLSTAPLSYFGDGRIGYGASLSQEVPYPGTLALRGERAAAEARVRERDLETVRLDLALEAARLFDRYRFVHRALDINEEHVELLESFQEIATSRYATGLAPQQAPLQAEVEAAHLHHRLVVLQSERRVIVARINALLHRGAREPLPAPRIEDPPPMEPIDAEAMSRSAIAHRPELAAQRAEIESRRATVSLERLDARPDFEAMTSFSSMWAMSDHRWMVGVGIRIPFWKGRIRAGIAEAEARVEESESTLAALEDGVQAEAVAAATELEEALHVARLYETRVFPASEDQIAAARSGFETGQVSMLALIEAERSLRDARLQYEDALSQAWTARARLDRSLGLLPDLGPPTVETNQSTSLTHPSDPELEP
jgi:outer membrane protein TolC